MVSAGGRGGRKKTGREMQGNQEICTAHKSGDNLLSPLDLFEQLCDRKKRGGVKTERGGLYLPRLGCDGGGEKDEEKEGFLHACRIFERQDQLQERCAIGGGCRRGGGE